MLVDEFINSLPVETQQIVKLRHHQKLTQADIAKIVSKDQSAISRLLGRFYLKLLDLIHSQVPHPNSGKPQRNSLSLQAATQLLEHYFKRKYPVKIT
ncbi:sigma factor-like helix-turn-helix DNA-binding protein [Chamaesiphon sp.]|uniref:sigma factor-like helix-turn-helix DNA-binding protein n=1 Tax=Chamaesiphon sp. TaxID=2814140 RepID=UPI003592FEE6